MTYANAPPIGTWQTPAGLPTQGDSAGANAGASGIAGMGGAGTGTGGAVGSASGMPAANPLIGSMNTGGVPGSGGMSAGGSGGSGMTGVSGMSAIGTGGMDADSGTGGMGGSTATALTLAFDVTTVDQRGRYSPRNVGAIWIETAAGDFVKTLKVWARTRGRYLTKFNNEAGGDRTDAVTSATIRPYVAHSVMWNLTDVSGNPVSQGDYKILIEVTDHDGTGNWAEVPFTYDGMPSTSMPPDQQYYTGMQIVMQ